MNLRRIITSIIHIRISDVFIVPKANSCLDIGVQFREVSSDILPDVKNFRNEEYQKVFKKFLENGDRGLYGYIQGKCVVHGWVSFNDNSKNKKVNGYFRLPSKSCLIHFCNVAESYRGRGIYKALLYQLYTSLCKGYDIYIDTGSRNTPALKAISYSGGIFKYRLYSIYFRSHCLISIPK